MKTATHPHVHVDLTAVSGNVFAIIGAVTDALRRKVDREAAEDFKKQALSCSTYDEVLALTMRTVEVS